MIPNDNSTQNSTQSPMLYKIKEPHQLTIVRRVVFSIVVLLALLGNTIVIQAIRSGRSRKPFTHYLVTCLAFAELSNSICMIFTFVYNEMWHWIFGSFLCHLILPTSVLTVGVITTTLACISVYRYQVIVTPHKKPPSKRVGMTVVAAMWIGSFVITLPLYVLYVQKETHPGYKDCITEHDLRTYDMARITLQFFIPVFVMIVSYGVAAIKIKQHMTFMENRSRQNRLNSNLSSLNTYLDSQVNGDNNLLTVPQQQHKQLVYIPNSHSPRGSVCHINRVTDQAPDYSDKRKSISQEDGNMIETERDIIKMFYVIVIVFLVCYIPYQVFFLCYFYNLVNSNSLPYFDLLQTYTSFLTVFPSALHPLCYGTMSRFYARAFSKLVLCKCKK